MRTGNASFGHRVWVNAMRGAATGMRSQRTDESCRVMSRSQLQRSLRSQRLPDNACFLYGVARCTRTFSVPEYALVVSCTTQFPATPDDDVAFRLGTSAAS